MGWGGGEANDESDASLTSGVDVTSGEESRNRTRSLGFDLLMEGWERLTYFTKPPQFTAQAKAARGTRMIR